MRLTTTVIGVMAISLLGGCATVDDLKLKQLAGYSLNLNQAGWTDNRFVSNELVIPQPNDTAGYKINSGEIDKRINGFKWRSEEYNYSYSCSDPDESERHKRQKANLERAIAQIIIQFDQHILLGGRRKIVFFIHGGLVGLDQANKDAYEIWRAFRESDTTAEFPIFINWDTGIFSATRDAFFRDGHVGERYKTTSNNGAAEKNSALTQLRLKPNQRSIPGIVLSPFRIWREFLSATGRAPFTLGAQTQSSLNKAPLLSNFGRPDGWEHVRFPRTLDRPRAISPTDVAKEVLPGTLRLFSPVYDFLGSGGYQQMKRRAANLIRHESDFAHGTYRRCSALARLFDELRAYDAVRLNAAKTYDYTSRSQKIRLPIRYNIVAHSLGAWVANDIIADNSDLIFDDALYLSPASTIADYAGKVIPYLKQHKNFRTHIFTLHPEREYSEVNYAKAVPVGSLLTWIDRFLNHPLNDFNRTLGDWRNLSAALTQIGYLSGAQRAQLRVSVFGQSKKYPLMHGDLNQPPQDKLKGYGGAKFWRWHEQSPLD